MQLFLVFIFFSLASVNQSEILFKALVGLKRGEIRQTKEVGKLQSIYGVGGRRERKVEISLLSFLEIFFEYAVQHSAL